ncbi:DUF4097 family beta strand repeat-containing protein [Gorillibacterium massiliense]|uniref:DUF4097 family beta strand repeat-containing protein n=1 Tax=Gorillibacterium massiliense TaxID=1280390 RepID=UPI0004AFDE02|nr:DUF4097 family beta strand repeat protein [Gorillibacterium massiliense]
MQRKLGGFTVAITLIVLGGAFLADQLRGTDWLGVILGWWPALLILLGLELIWLQMRRTENNNWRISWKLVILLAIVLVAANWYHSSKQSGTMEEVLHGNLSFGDKVNTVVDSVIDDVVDKVSEGNLVTGKMTDIPLTEQTISAPDAGILKVSNNVGITKVTGISGDSIRMTGVIHVRTDNEEAAKKRAAEIDVNLHGGSEAVLQVVDHGSKINPPTVELVIEVPEGMEVEVDSSVGDITATHVASATIHTTTGRITLQDIDGDGTAEATTGSVRGINIQGNANLSATTGAITAEEISGDLEINTTTGSIVVKNAKKGVHVKNTTGSIQVDAGSPIGGDYDINTVTGKIGMEINNRSSAMFEATTTMGGISGDIPWKGKTHNKTATLGSGDYHVQLGATTGKIEVNTLD